MQEVDHKSLDVIMEAILRTIYLIHALHVIKRKLNSYHQRMNDREPNPYMNRCNEKTWEALVKIRKRTQVVCKLHEPEPR